LGHEASKSGVASPLDADFKACLKIPISILPESVDSPAPSHQTDLGILGETFVAEWLRSQQWQILYHRWSCRFGELDLVAQSSPQTESLIAFVEVKTRSQGNWDSDGLLAVTPAKQAKLWKTAQLFLVKHPHLAELPCRFDIAIVKRQRFSQSKHQSKNLANSTSFSSFSQVVEGYELALQNYIPNAFTQC
jgi:putative endonuclease